LQVLPLRKVPAAQLKAVDEVEVVDVAVTRVEVDVIVTVDRSSVVVVSVVVVSVVVVVVVAVLVVVITLVFLCGSKARGSTAADLFGWQGFFVPDGESTLADAPVIEGVCKLPAVVS